MKKLPKRFVDKKTALVVLERDGPMAVTEFGERLRAIGKLMKGPRKAFNVLSKLFNQGLVRRMEKQKLLRYKMSRGEKLLDIERIGRVVLWGISDRGKKRLAYYAEKEKKKA